MLDDEHLYLDHVQLRARGWTRSLVVRFLVHPDRYETVSHWLNYKGKATYFIERIVLAESQVDFQRAFSASVCRRKLTNAEQAEIQRERDLVDDAYREWLKKVTPEDVALMLAASEFAASFFEAARARGYRTPHK